MRKFFKRHLLRDPFEREIRRWFRDRGDQTLRLDYPLNQDSIVIDVGGYVGDFAASLVERYGCQVFVFEPHPEFYKKCVERFSETGSVRVFDFGLSDTDGEFDLSDDKDGSSFENQKNSSQAGITCKLRRFSTVVSELGIERVDLIKLNIEGGEYPLMKHIIEQGMTDSIDDFQIQFHNFIDGAEEMRSDIRRDLEKTHDCTWNYDFVWENWRRRTH